MMWHKILIAVGGLSAGTAIYMGVAPEHWYQQVPGVKATGPMNLHFARDVAFAFLASGGALIWAGLKSDRSAALCGVAWLCFHALFHAGIWMHRGMPVDVIALTNVTGIQLPALLALVAALKLNQGEARHAQVTA